MKRITLLSGICAFVLVPFGAAVAGACSSEIETVNKLLASRDAGSGPTTGASGASAGQHPPAAATGAEDASTAASTSAESSVRPQHAPTAALNQATQGGAASPQEERSRTRSASTAAPERGGPRGGAGERIGSAEAALEEARGFDRDGQEAACIEAIERAKVLAR